MNRERKCGICGKTFIASKANIKYCCDKCRYEAISIKNIEIRKSKSENKKASRKKKKDNQQAIIDIAVEAKKAGMSYGQYVARMGL